VQAPGIEIYSQLLPGITNVTDRARYYSFYAWLFQQFEQRGLRNPEQWQPLLRKAECLFALIALRHAQHNNGSEREHSAAVVGSAALSNAIGHISQQDTFRLSSFTGSDNALGTRYFKNPYGGLGQYYFGVLVQLGIMAGDSIVQARLVSPTGIRLAQAMDVTVDGYAFFDAIEHDVLTLATLDQLVAFCPCHLASSVEERQILMGLFMRGCVSTDTGADTPTNEDSASRQARSTSLAYFQWLTSQCQGAAGHFARDHFRSLIYTQTDSQGEKLRISPLLSPVAANWQVYQRHELLSVALQGLFFSLLREADLRSLNERFGNTQALADWFWLKGPGARLLSGSEHLSLNDWLAQRAQILPAFEHWQDGNHEMQVLAEILRLSREKSPTDATCQALANHALTLLVALLIRPENQADYDPVVFRPEYLEHYPVNLRRLRQDLDTTLGILPVGEAWLRFSLEYCLHAHLRVALRKLRAQGQNTFRFESSEIGLVIKEIPLVAETSPRLNQSLRILTDLGVLREDADTFLPAGESLLEWLA